jgi:hypothetical protein
MFLIGMCDIFLLLYLTAVAEMDSRPVSSLTVADYSKLEASATEYQERSQRAEQDLEKQRAMLEAKAREVADKEQAAADAVERAKALEIRVSAALAEANAAKKELTAAEQRDAATKAAREQLEVEVARRGREAATREAALRAEVARVSSDLSVAHREREAEVTKTSEVTRLAEEARITAQQESSRAADERKRAEEALAEAKRQREAAEAATAAAALAKRGEAEAKLIAQQARQRESAALQYADRAVETATNAQTDATRAMQRVADVRREQETVQGRLTSVEKPLNVAYLEKVDPMLVEISVQLGQGGSPERSVAVRGPAVRMDGERLLLIPLAALGVESGDEGRIVAASMARDGGRIARVLRSADQPTVVAFVLPSEGAAAAPNESRTVRELMPTLLLVRGDFEGGKRTRIAAVSDEFRALERDSLSADGAQRLWYRPASSGQSKRGTHELLPGDHVVDLEGTYVGLVVAPNAVARLTSVSGWQEVDL